MVSPQTRRGFFALCAAAAAGCKRSDPAPIVTATQRPLPVGFGTVPIHFHPVAFALVSPPGGAQLPLGHVEVSFGARTWGFEDGKLVWVEHHNAKR